MGGIKKTINGNQKNIAEYIKRREEFRKIYGVGSLEYRERVRKINIKIGNWRRTLRRQKELRNKIDELILNIKTFMGYDLFKNNKSPKTKEGKCAKGIYFKYGIENKFYGTDLSNRIGLKGDWTASKYRRRFTRSFKTNKYNREMYHRFLNYIKQIKNE